MLQVPSGNVRLKSEHPFIHQTFPNFLRLQWKLLPITPCNKKKSLNMVMRSLNGTQPAEERSRETSDLQTAVKMSGEIIASFLD